MRKTMVMRAAEVLKSSSFFSARALRMKPDPRKAMAVRKKEMRALVSP